MRILYDSKLLAHKDPFGTLTPGKSCKLSIHIPSSVQATEVVCLVRCEDGEAYAEFPLEFRMKKGPSEIFTGELVLEEGNTWHDTFWGVDAKTGEGLNHLGRILMKVRDELREKEL